MKKSLLGMVLFFATVSAFAQTWSLDKAHAKLGGVAAGRVRIVCGGLLALATFVVSVDLVDQAFELGDLVA